MPELVAVEDPPGPGFVAALQRCWDRGDAVLPVDARLPAPARDALFAQLRPTRRERDGVTTTLAGGVATRDGDAVVVATSGTTGDPKGVVLTHAAIAASAAATSARLGVDPERDVWLCCLPVAHAGGLGVVTRALITGTSLRMFPAFDAHDITAAVEALAREGRPALVSLVATALLRIEADLFKVILLGGDAPPSWPSAGRPAPVVVTYGLTETAGGCVYDGMPLDGVEVRVAEDGEIGIRGPVLGRAYRTAAGEDELSGWLATGDAGRWQDGRLVVDGRIAEVIVTGGEKVWPAAVEDVIRRCPGVKAAAVVGRPDAEWGQRVVAVVVPDGEPPSLDALRDAVKAVLPPWAAPRDVEFVDALPTTGLGKVRRRLL